MFYKILIVLLGLTSLISASLNIKQLNSFEAKFHQNIKSTTGNNIKYYGKVFIKNNGRILWKYETPIKKDVYVLNNFVIIDEPELEQAIYTELESKINIIQLIKDSQKIGENIYTSEIDDIDYNIEVLDNKISSISYKDKLDNNIKIEFLSIKQNEKINDNIFKFTAPEHYDIIRK